jgi:hypothetical protein
VVFTGASAVARPVSAAVAVALCRSLRSLGGEESEFLSACHITGTLRIAIAVPFVYPCL